MLRLVSKTLQEESPITILFKQLAGAVKFSIHTMCLLWVGQMIILRFGDGPLGLSPDEDEAPAKPARRPSKKAKAKPNPSDSGRRRIVTENYNSQQVIDDFIVAWPARFY